ncbi:DegT/DnrJ/EryC1/StrS family aminotransferase [Planobispora siamensis]|uniref:Aminotransferase DegT n=1 Tax=Planobispora siamensis TaxID=936338 RepID=A0A8J3SEL1_9ACTN|nr:DegT/DnrJ/EryC1/StrS family aminotransferase [Planobispora siamensis]GIH92932.1 aminotransferase DegT [Planobispora siamensis]
MRSDMWRPYPPEPQRWEEETREPCSPEDEPEIPVARPHMWGDEADRVADLVRRGWLSSRAPVVRDFEEGFAAAVGARHAVAASSGTTALHLALNALRIRAGDEVIVPGLCMAAPVFAVMQTGAVPVPADVDETWNLDPGRLEERITERTRAVIVTHTYGQPADMDRIKALCDCFGLSLIEDAAEALGATYGGRRAGTLGRVGCFSFYANKTITTGEGGMLVTDEGDLCERARWKRDMCFGAGEEDRFVHREMGYNYRMSGLQAGLGLAQLAHLDRAVRAKTEIGGWYRRELAGVPGLGLPVVRPGTQHAYWVFGIEVEEGFPVSRHRLQAELRAGGVGTRRFFEAVHRQPFMGRAGSDEEFPVSSRLADHGFYLPSYAGLRRDQVREIARRIREAALLPDDRPLIGGRR